MLNGDGNENGIKIKRSNQQNTNLHVQHTFSLISKKTNLHEQQAFSLSLPLFCTTTTLFCGTKTSKFQVTHCFWGGIVVCAYPIFCLLCSCSLLFFTAAHFHLAGRKHFLGLGQTPNLSRVEYIYNRCDKESTSFQRGSKRRTCVDPISPVALH